MVSRKAQRITFEYGYGVVIAIQISAEKAT